MDRALWREYHRIGAQFNRQRIFERAILLGAGSGDYDCATDPCPRHHRSGEAELCADFVDQARIGPGRREYASARSTLGAIEREYGVPGEILIAIWGHETAYGNVRGGFDLSQALATLADTAMVFACFGALDAPEPVGTVTLDTQFLRPASGDSLEARAEVTRTGKSMMFARCTIVAQPSGKEVAMATATFAR